MGMGVREGWGVRRVGVGRVLERQVVFVKGSREGVEECLCVDRERDGHGGCRRRTCVGISDLRFGLWGIFVGYILGVWL